ncbi:hypothetical protein [Spirosoma jeollabukense]
MKKVLYLSLALFLASLLITCKEKNADFSPGTVDSRLTGSWQLYERRFSKDSILYSYVQQKDSTRNKDSIYVVTIDTIRVSRDTSFYTTKRYPSAPPQTLTFGTDGTLSRNGTEMTYYAPIKYYRIDPTYPDNLFINFFISTNRANVPFLQGLEFKKDTLLLKPFCEQYCYSKFLRVR